MKNRITLAALVAIIASVGCSTSTPTASPEQTKSFVGGPMPPDAQKRMADYANSKGGPGAAAAADKARAAAASGH